MHIDIGRNEPCPCGSGLKFKKCCIDNPLNLFPHHVPERKHKWYSEDVMELPTSKIIEKLVMLGIPFTQEAFLIDVHNHYGSGDICKEWEKRYTITAKGFDEDFPWMAAEVLWRRLVPDKISTMQLDDWVQDGYELTEDDASVAGCDLWLKVWENLKPRFTKDMRKVEDADEVSFKSQYLSNWIQDFDMELSNAAVDTEDKSYYDRRIIFCRECMGFFPDSIQNSISMRRGIAEALYMSGRIEEAEQEFQKLVLAYPNDPWSYAAWGDMYADVDGGIYNPEKAEELYHRGLGLQPSEDKYLEERIRDLKVVGLLKPLKG
jgi:hypothetical protein